MDSLLPAFENKPWNTSSTPILYLVGMPLGDPQDISLRALRVLKEAELLICESRKSASKFYKAWDIPFPRDTHIEWNEHNHASEASQICEQLILKTKSSVLISDAGMPVLADPGQELLFAARESGIQIDVVPGATAITTALALAGLGGQGFRFAGFPPRKRIEREHWIQKLAQSASEPIVLYETPYRLQKLLGELANLKSTRGKSIFICTNLCTSEQKTWNMPLSELKQQLNHIPKGPPVVILY